MNGARFLLAILLALLGRSRGNSRIAAHPETHRTTSELGVAPRVDQYMKEQIDIYEETIHSMEVRVVEFTETIATRLQILGQHMEWIEKKLQAVNDDLNSMRVLDDIKDYCVHLYMHKLPTMEEVTLEMQECGTKAENVSQVKVDAPEESIRDLRNYYDTEIMANMSACKSQHAGNYGSIDYANCILATGFSLDVKTEAVFQEFDNELKTIEFKSNLKADQVFKCYANIIFKTFKSVGGVVGMVDECIDLEGDVDDLGERRCPYYMSWILHDLDVKVPMLMNPFRGMNKTQPCIQINFIKK